MRVVIQRVIEAAVTIEERVVSSVSNGLLILAGFEDEDSYEDIDYIANKIVNLRIFDDDNGVMNRSVLDINGEILIVSQFTLHAQTRKGNRPSYIRAAKPEISVPLYNKFVESIGQITGKKPGTGVFGADMKVSLINDGPVTIWMDSKERQY